MASLDPQKASNIRAVLILVYGSTRPRDLSRLRMFSLLPVFTRNGSKHAGLNGGPIERFILGDVVWLSLEKALAWRNTKNGNDAHRDSKEPERQSCRLDGES